MVNRIAGLCLIMLAPACWAAPPGLDTDISVLFADASDPAGPGCAFSVVRDGSLVMNRAWGLANLEQPAPITPRTVFEAGSVSKQFTAAAIAILASQGRLSLDDDVRKYLAEMPDYGAPITVRMLLTHTSGVRNWDDIVELSGRAREDGSGYTQAEALETITRQFALNFVPGTEYLYSNSNYVLAAAIVERVSGQSFAAFSREQIFVPLGMTATQWRDDYTRIIPGRATAYTPGEDGQLHIDMPIENVVGPGGLLTTVEDLQRWNAALDTPPAVARKWTSLLLSTKGRLADGMAIPYGMGLETERVSGRDVTSHAGATGGYRTYLAREPKSQTSLALLCSAGALNTEDIGPALLAKFLPAENSRAVTSSTTRHDIPKGVEGKFRNVMTRALVTVASDADGMHFNGGEGFAFVDEDRFENSAHSREAVVTRDADGSAVSISLTRVGNSAVRLERVQSWSPSAQELAVFEGVYYSEDARAWWRIQLANGKLRASGPRGEAFDLSPTYPDTFSAVDAAWTLAFTRNSTSVINAISFFKTRTRGVQFVRG